VRKHRPKHVELIGYKINESKSCILLVIKLRIILTMHRHTNIKIGVKISHHYNRIGKIMVLLIIKRMKIREG